jgi:hypothetical protein
MNELSMNAADIYKIVVVVTILLLLPFGLWIKKETRRMREEHEARQKHGQKDTTQATA